ncbi:methyltransferase-like protein 22 isoform X3 [Pantherophis guttatus]|uniref:Methyltransferase-like protein 22 isoform X3 n=1 Tax=Pantherophis guttatus TaxID=94885 RepID=A0A6P9CAH6_PANGU|nr:methyltransferase-like protein 22 isoform X3 [Pantherophis guttatus]XP_060548977.1 methyltransferase-like protein 22 isoform X3 [Pantherophis guttatus]
MDETIFRSDTVLSDIHLHTANRRHFMVRLNAVGQPVFLSQFRLLLDDSQRDPEKEERGHKTSLGCQSRSEEEFIAEDRAGDDDSPDSPENKGDSCRGFEALLDEDGDLQVVRKAPLPPAGGEDQTRTKACPIILSKNGDVLEEQEHESDGCNIVKIEHTMATPLEDVGKQVWRGAFLLADYILSKQDMFKGCTALELGGGIGFVSIIMSKAAKTIYCTDVGEDLLSMCERNVALNKHVTEPTGSEIRVKKLDWQQDDFCTVFYDDDLTDAFFKTLSRITRSLRNSCTVYFSMEKRFNFTLRQMDVVCEAYNHFRSTLEELLKTSDGEMRYYVQLVELSFPQRIVYERVPQLELWKLRAQKVPGGSHPQLPRD